MLSERGLDVTGIDASRALVESARAAGGGTFHVCDYASLATAPELRGERYDAIVCKVHPWIARGGADTRMDGAPRLSP